MDATELEKRWRTDAADAHAANCQAYHPAITIDASCTTHRRRRRGGGKQNEREGELRACLDTNMTSRVLPLQKKDLKIFKIGMIPVREAACWFEAPSFSSS